MKRISALLAACLLAVSLAALPAQATPAPGADAAETIIIEDQEVPMSALPITIMEADQGISAKAIVCIGVGILGACVLVFIHWRARR